MQRETQQSLWINVWQAVLLVAMALLPLIGGAQTLERRDTVAERLRPGLEADGIPVGGLTVLPNLGAELFFNDNIFANDAITQDDTAIILSPEVRLQSRSARHKAQLGANADLARYSEYDTENYDDVRLWALASMGLGAGEIEGEARLSNLHEYRTSPEDRGCVQTGGQVRCTDITEFQSNQFGAAYTWSPSRFLVKAGLTYSTLDFDPTQLPAGGSLSNDDRDRSRAELGLRLGYGLSPDYALYFETRVDSIDFDQREDRNGFRRSSDGTEVRLGMLLDFTGSTFGEFYLGYLEREFDDQRFNKASGPTFGADVSWNITGLTTLSLNAERTIDNTTILGAAGITRSTVTIGADHELFRNLVLSANAEFGTDDFEDIDRQDDLSGFTLGGKYLMNRYVQVLFGYRFQDRDTSPESSTGRIFEMNQLFLRVTGQL